MKKLFILLMLLNGLCLLSQTSNNPFDVEKENSASTPPLIQESAPISEPTPTNKNPFDVASNRITIEKKPVYINPANEIQPSDSNKKNSFIFWISLVSLLITTIALTRDRKAFNNFPKLISNRNYLKLVNRDLNSTRLVIYILLYFSFFFSFATFLYLCGHHFYGLHGFKIYLLILIGVIGTYAIRHLALLILRYIVTTKQTISDHGFLIMVSNGITGMALIPFNLLFNYAESLKMTGFLLGAAIIVVFYIWRQVTGIFLSNADKQVNFFHFFIYICSLEIAPALVIIKLIHGYI